jgi:hypothetical protein
MKQMHADGVTAMDADFDQGSIDLGMKIKGLHLQVEYYFRYLSNFNAHDWKRHKYHPNSIFDHGFYASASYEVIPLRCNVYFDIVDIRSVPEISLEVIVGTNYCPAVREA